MITDYFNQTFNVLTVSYTTSPSGNQQKTWTAGTDQTGNIRQLNGNEVYKLGIVGYQVTDRLICSRTITITTDNMIRYNGSDYKVVNVNAHTNITPVQIGEYQEIDLYKDTQLND